LYVNIDQQKSKMKDPKEAQRIQAMMGNAREQNGLIHSNEKDVTVECEDKVELSADGSLDIKTIPTVYIKNCENCVYKLKHRVNKVLVEGCKDVTVIIDGKIMTATIEAWKCEGVKFELGSDVKTMQVDMSKNIDIYYTQKDHFASVVWQDVEDMKITVDGENKHVLETGFDQMKAKYPDSNPQVDQYIVRYVAELGDELSVERCIRLQNGFLSTEREAADWDKRNTLAKERYMENFLKEAGITLNKKKAVGPKVGRNDACPCGSGKKYKKCCMNKKSLTGVAEDNAESLKTYIDEASKSTKKSK